VRPCHDKKVFAALVVVDWTLVTRYLSISPIVLGTQGDGRKEGLKAEETDAKME
jgi:hypothetical protein